MTEVAATISNEQKVRIGFDRLRTHQFNLAELIFLQVLASTPEDPSALRLLGVARCRMGRTDEGLANLRAAVAAAPGLEVAWNDLAVGLRLAGEDAAAAEAHARAVTLRDPALNPLAPVAQLTFSMVRAAHPFTIVDYPYSAMIRYGSGRPSHAGLAALFETGRDRYAAFLAEMGEIQGDFAEIGLGGAYEAEPPFWLNVWFSGLDGMALTQMLRRHNPRRFVEIGSGVSTKFARRAVQTYGLRTRLISIDPEPRNEIDRLCDQVIRQPLETCAPELFDSLAAGDILFLDSSHRAFQNSDVTVFFLEILPRLKPGVIVHLHDIYLPDDYISGHLDKLWNEQYLLATALLFGGSGFEVLFPCWYVDQDPELGRLARDLLCRGPLSQLDLYGVSFWMTKT